VERLKEYINKMLNILGIPHDSIIPLLTITAMAFITAMAVVLFSGCSHSIDGYNCRCNCGEKNSIFECNGKEKIVEVKGNN